MDTGLSASDQTWQGNILLFALANYALVSTANSGVNLSSVLGARINTVRNTFKF